MIKSGLFEVSNLSVAAISMHSLVKTKLLLRYKYEMTGDHRAIMIHVIPR